MRTIEQGPVVAKFGGSSLANAERVKRVGEIVSADPLRRYVVVSAPGRINGDDSKITDMLLACHSLVAQGLEFDEAFDQVISRYEEIGRGLAIHTSVAGWLESVHSGIQKGNGSDWIASRGEWLMANTFATFMGGSFVDAVKLIGLQQNGQVDPVTYQIIAEQLNDNNTLYVIPGFYGANEAGAVKIFPRGGSDITGAIIAKGVKASVYENWTDVDGVKAADPRVVFRPATIPQLTYGEMRELGNGGAGVLQRDTILPVYEAGIPIHVKNSSNSDHPGTVIVREREVSPRESVIGIAGKKGFVSIQVQRFGMNEELGVASSVLEIIRSHGIPYEHGPTGIDSMSVIVNQVHLGSSEEAILNEIQIRVKPDRTSVLRDIGLICLVGEGISQKTVEVLDILSWTLGQMGINIKLVSYRAGGNSLVFGVANEDLLRAINGLYNTFIR